MNLTEFEICLEHVLKREGGFVNHPMDTGGPTNFGITADTLARYRGAEVSDKDVFEMTLKEASKIYENNFWVPMRLDRLRAKRVQLILFDQGVNRGPGPAIKALQETLNIYFAEKLDCDGIIGNATDVAVMTAPESALCRKLLQSFQKKYVEQVLKTPSQIVFLQGWLNRLNSLWDAIAS